MALRVLLADESTTIKKVMQLALQDFAVEVKAVHVGVDVVEVARQFQPDIIFADVLLQKKNGYEVCTELKADAQLRSIPVVLMWSSFMDLDEALAKGSGADRRLEKPFDIENLRQLLLELVPKTHTQRLAHFLKFPASLSDPMKKEEVAKRESASPTPPAEPTAAPAPASLKIPQAKIPQGATPKSVNPPKSVNQGIASSMPQPPPSGPPPPPKAQVRDGTRDDWNMDSFEDISKYEPTSISVVQDAPALDLASDDDDDEVFSELRLQGNTQPQAKAPGQDLEATATREIPMPPSAADESDEAWSHQDLSRFKIEMPPVTASNPEHGIEIELPDENQVTPMAPRAFAPPPRNAAPAADDDDEAPEQFTYGRTRTHDDFESGNDLLLGSDEINDSDLSLDAGNELNFDHATPQMGGLELKSLEDDQDVHDDSDNASDAEATFRIENPLRNNEPNENEFPAGEVGKIPQLSPERLEQIIRAQAREIVESVVRKIVPDLATDIIREELQRLLEDTSVRDPRRSRDDY